jgi:SAM-dependent methyltransferase
MPRNDAEQYLQTFHERHAGWCSRVLRQGDLGDGRNSYAATADAVVSGLAADATLLDVACGDGYLLLELSHRTGGALYGLDLSPSELELARAWVPRGTFREAHAASLPWPDAHFDRVTCHMAFMLFADPAAVRDEIVRVLKPRGRLHLVVGHGPPEGLFAEYVDCLRRVVRTSCTTLVSLGHPLTRSATGLRELLTVPSIEGVETEPWPLQFRGGAEDLWQVLESTYDVDQLSGEVAERLHVDFGRACERRQATGHSLSVVIPMLHVVATKAG